MTSDFPPIGSDGIALETKNAGEKCKCYFEGYDVVEVLAREQIREKSHVLIIDGKRGAREGSPEELKFLVVATGAFLNVNTDNPLPVTMGSRAVIHITVTAVALGPTQIVPAPAAGSKIRVHYFSYSNNDVAAADVAMQFGTRAVRHRHTLAALGGNLPVNLTDANWDGQSGEALNAWLAAAHAGGVRFNVAYTIEAV